VLLRAVAMMVTMGLGLVLMVIVLDKLLWSALAPRLHVNLRARCGRREA
jgi:hypothetical protein